MGDLWVFGYGSLMWRPGFTPAEIRPATLRGYRRCFCITSVHHRGSPERPGLVLGLDRGGMCRGLALRVTAADANATLANLRAREQVNGVYREARVAVTLEGSSEPVEAIAYIAERAHPSYAGRLPVAVQARIIRAARGLSGANLEYLASTLTHLAGLGIREQELERVAVLAGPVMIRDEGAGRRARIEGLVRLKQAESIIARRLRRTDRKRFGYRIRVGTS